MFDCGKGNRYRHAQRMYKKYNITTTTTTPSRRTHENNANIGSFRYHTCAIFHVEKSFNTKQTTLYPFAARVVCST